MVQHGKNSWWLMVQYSKKILMADGCVCWGPTIYPCCFFCITILYLSWRLHLIIHYYNAFVWRRSPLSQVCARFSNTEESCITPLAKARMCTHLSGEERASGNTGECLKDARMWPRESSKTEKDQIGFTGQLAWRPVFRRWSRKHWRHSGHIVCQLLGLWKLLRWSGLLQ